MDCVKRIVLETSFSMFFFYKVKDNILNCLEIYIPIGLSCAALSVLSSTEITGSSKYLNKIV